MSTRPSAIKRLVAPAKAGTQMLSKCRATATLLRCGVQGAPACNDWAFWHVKRDGALVPIDAPRQKLRAELF